MRPTPSLVLALAFLFGCGDDGSGTADSTGSGTAADGESTASPATSRAATSEDDGSGAPTSSDPVTTGPADSTGAGSSSDGADGSTGAPSCPDVGDPCTICESTMCPAEYCGCFDNGSCLLLAQCVADCDIGDTECAQPCWTQYPDGISDGALLTHCAATLCSDACGPYVPLTPCQECLYGECPDEMNVCVGNPDCFALLQCLDACEDPGCENTCYIAHPDGLADSGPVGECAQDACLRQCA